MTRDEQTMTDERTRDAADAAAEKLYPKPKPPVRFVDEDHEQAYADACHDWEVEVRDAAAIIRAELRDRDAAVDVVPMLQSLRTLIAAADEDDLGRDERNGYPYRDEAVYRIDKAIASLTLTAAAPQPSDGPDESFSKFIERLAEKVAAGLNDYKTHRSRRSFNHLLAAVRELETALAPQEGDDAE